MPSPAATSPKSPVTPFKVWRSNLPEGVSRKDKRAPSSEKKKQLPNARTSILGPTLRHTINASSDVASVKNSEFARCTIGNHEMKLLQILENTDSADYVTAYEEFRRKVLHKHDPLKVVKISRPKKNMAKLKMAVNLIKGNKLAFLSKAQLAFSPLNPDNKKDTTALMKKIRQMKLEAGLEEDSPESPQHHSVNEYRGVDLESSEPIEHDATMDAQKEKEIEKAFKYVVGEFASSPFTSTSLLKSSSEEKKRDKEKKVNPIVTSTGVKNSASMKELRDKGFIKNAQALRVKKIREEQKKKAEAAFAKKKSATEASKKKSNNANPKPKKKAARTHPYPADKYSEHQKMMEAKLPEKLRRECDKKYNKLMEPFSERCSARSWSKIKAKEDVHKEYESLTITGTIGHPFTPSRTQAQIQAQAQQPQSSGELLTSSMEVPESSAADDDEEEVFARLNTSPGWQQNTVELISGDAILYPMEREGLFTVDDLEDLSVNSEKSHEMLSDGSDAGLFNTLDLMQLDVDEKDEVLQHEEDVKSPDGALTVSMGALLYSHQLKDEMNTHPACAGMGGVSQSIVHSSVKPYNKQDLFSYHSKYSIDVNKRPKSANTSAHVRCSSDYEKIDEIPNHVQKKRLVVTRHRAPEVWIT
mmetsp:Transcript_11392/g.18539  ORF Transcript_11392/g.18539 Transcript_11392/m.18539 type:complete len:643 (+) Transcript_11392:124-2052(+)